MTDLPQPIPPVRAGDGPEAWNKAAWIAAGGGRNGPSVLTWVGGGVEEAPEGRMPLDQVRARVVAQIAELEARVTAETDEVLRLSGEVRNLTLERDRAYNKRQETRKDLRDAHERLKRLFPLPPEEVSQ